MEMVNAQDGMGERVEQAVMERVETAETPVNLPQEDEPKENALEDGQRMLTPLKKGERGPHPTTPTFQGDLNHKEVPEPTVADQRSPLVENPQREVKGTVEIQENPAGDNQEDRPMRRASSGTSEPPQNGQEEDNLREEKQETALSTDPPKRGRGRPRKSIPLQEAQSPKTPAQKRGRGRPRKTPRSQEQAKISRTDKPVSTSTNERPKRRQSRRQTDDNSEEEPEEASETPRQSHRVLRNLEPEEEDPQGEQGVDAPIINGGVARRGPGRPRKPETPRKGTRRSNRLQEVLEEKKQKSPPLRPLATPKKAKAQRETAAQNEEEDDTPIRRGRSSRKSSMASSSVATRSQSGTPLFRRASTWTPAIRLGSPSKSPSPAPTSATRGRGRPPKRKAPALRARSVSVSVSIPSSSILRRSSAVAAFIPAPTPSSSHISVKEVIGASFSLSGTLYTCLMPDGNQETLTYGLLDAEGQKMAQKFAERLLQSTGTYSASKRVKFD